MRLGRRTCASSRSMRKGFSKELRVESLEFRVESLELRVIAFGNYQLSIINCQLSIINCQLSAEVIEQAFITELQLPAQFLKQVVGRE